MKIEWEKSEVLPGEGIALERRLAFGQEMSCLQVIAPESGELNMKPHWHENEQWVVVTEGTLVFEVEGVEYELNAGDVAYIPSRKRHTATRVGEGGAILLEFSAPARLDLVPGSIVPSSMQFD
ncbi:cupin domain-containing protein [Streptomyces sp. NPDC002088]|uniref:cupin domain-containing protein n=1 Tax=unclassified Streptomyces TaxID=2593676 RepID=UPI003327D88B